MGYSRHKIIFHHLPKTAGTTLISLLDQAFDQTDICPQDFFNIPSQDVREEHLALSYQQLIQYSLIHNHYPVPLFDSFSKEYFRFTFLREPKARLISLYYDLKTKSDQSLRCADQNAILTAMYAKSLPLGDFLKKEEHPVPALFDNGQVRLLSGSLEKKRLDYDDLEKAKQTLDRLDFVGITGLFSSSLTLLCARTGILLPHVIESLNQGKIKVTPVEMYKNESEIPLEFTMFDEQLYRYGLEKFDHICNSLLIGGKNYKHLTINYRSQKEITLTMDQGFKGDGWHAREGVGSEKVWKWSGPATRSTVSFFIAEIDIYLLQIYIISVIKQEIVDDMNIYCNGEAVAWQHKGVKLGEQLIEAVIDKTAIKLDENIIMLEVPYTISHATVEPETHDYREKGIAVTKFVMKPFSKISLET